MLRTALTTLFPLRLHAGSLVAWLCLMAATTCLGGLTIQINPGSTLASNTAAMLAFQRAAEEWSSMIANEVTIYVDADLAVFDDANVIGATGYTGTSAELNRDYATVIRPVLAARASTPGLEILNYLPTTLTANHPSGTSFTSSTVGILRANQRVLGLLDASDTGADGSITFNSTYAFDYDRSDGVDFGKTDFQTVAAHEIGHLLGFISDADEYDVGYTDTNLTTLDLFRFAAGQTPTSYSQFQTYAREMSPGVLTVLTDTSTVFGMSTGYNLGDGFQASHWKDDTLNGGVLIGLMDPNLSPGDWRPVSASDLRALELIGYTLVPEPGVWSLLLLGLTQLLFSRRRATI